MLKKINRILRIVGLNLVHAKKPRTGSIIPRKPSARIARSVNEGSTHYVGDACDGGHCEVNAKSPATSDITGPTS